MGSTRIAVVTPLAAALLGLLAPLAATAGEGAAQPPAEAGGASEDGAERALPAPELPPLETPYNRGTLLGVSLAVTVIGAGIGGGFAIGAGDSPGFAIAGSSIGGLAIAIGPAIGHLRIHNNLQGAFGLVGRTLLAGGATVFFVASSFVGVCYAPNCGCGEDDSEASCDERRAEEAQSRRMAVGLGIGFELAALTWAVIDLATLPRAVQRANEKASEQKISAAAVAPFVAPGREGATVAGLAFSMRF